MLKETRRFSTICYALGSVAVLRSVAMVLLLLGVLLFALVHFVPSLTPTLRHGAITKIREDGYKGLFSLLLLASFALMIIGWRSADYTFICQPPRSSIFQSRNEPERWVY